MQPRLPPEYDRSPQKDPGSIDGDSPNQYPDMPRVPARLAQARRAGDRW